MLLSEKKTVTEISRTLNIPCKNIKRWSLEGIARKRGGGRSKMNPTLEEDVFRWIRTHYHEDEPLQIEDIQKYALSRSIDEHFRASKGWAMRFVERFHLNTFYEIV